MRVDELERELRDARPEAEQEFTRRLDEWAAAGFPRDRGLGQRRVPGAGPLERAWERLRAAPPRRILMPVGAAGATLVVIGAVLVSQRDSGSELAATSAPPSQSPPATADSGGGDTAAEASGGKAAAPGALQASTGERLDSVDRRSAQDVGSQALLQAPPRAGGIARGTDKRLYDATAQVVLGAGPERVQEVANEVVGVTDRHDGIVLDSQVTSDQRGARADFTLEIPFAQLDSALTDLSDLADVISRTEASQDITAGAVRARKQLADIFDQIRGARAQLLAADTAQERFLIKARLRSLNASADAQRAKLHGVKRQARFATVTVAVTSDRPTGSGGGGDGNWSIGEALDDAGNVLVVIAGVALISLAVIAPLGLVATLCWLVVTRARHRLREQALDA